MLEFDTEYDIQITYENYNTRIDKYLSDTFSELSRTYIQKLIKDGQALVNSKTVRPNYRLSDGDTVNITFPKPSVPDIIPENIPIEIIYDDEDIAVINKPKNMVVHPAPGHYQGTLVNALMYYFGDNLSGINGVMRPGIVHRIDKDTTGLLIVCKNDKAHRNIAEQLAEHSITRKYHAIVCGIIKEDEGTVNKNIGRSKNDRKKMAVVNCNEGKPAITHYKVLKRYEGYTYIECSLETGRTHQIRVHMASIGYPLLGDTVYGYSCKKQPFKTEGQVLHAKTIGIIHPSTGKYIEFDSEIPNYFNDILTKINNKQI